MRNFLEVREVDGEDFTNEIFLTYTNFEDKVRDNFGNPDEERAAAQQLLQLRQKGPASKYAVTFKSLAAKAGWGDDETDASDYALGAVIGQRDDQGKLHPIAFFSYKLKGAELNYGIPDKEFMAIVMAFREFKHFLKGSLHQVKVYTDHQNLTRFTTTREFTGR
ncbi:hypothetical protein DL766_007895 [Monosporascus sp. MC13-8B]|nr:hypothetical protein DL763_003546 [Monosporascus cannonballus]RYP21621.1 hypothetical protein DL766_007895 [Monosporascus sp. MC13-8B]